MDGQRKSLGTAAGQGLLATLGGVDGGIEKLSLDFGSAQAVLLDQMPQRLLNLGVQGVSQLRGLVAVGGPVHKGLHGCQQRSLAGEPDAFMRPQSVIVKASGLGERVKAPAVRVTGEVAEVLQFPKHREIDVGAEDALEIRQISDFPVAQVLAKDGGIESGGPHNVIVPTAASFKHEL